MTNLSDQLYAVGLLPVVTVDSPGHAVPLAQALIDGGIPAAEITFRTPAAAQSIAEIAQAFPDFLAGAGTVLTVQQAEAAVSAGAKFLVSPGLNPDVVQWCFDHGTPIYPGISSPTELEAARKLGLTEVKFFPAQQSGGSSMLRALSAPYPQMRFIPTGGISVQNLEEYLALPNVLCCGGSFVASARQIASGEFDKIRMQAKQAVSAILDAQLLHVGINCTDAAQARDVAGSFQDLFGFDVQETPGSFFAGTAAEICKTPFLGEHGHLAFSVAHIERAVAWFRFRGIDFREETRVQDEKGLVAVYFKDEISGFAIHLRRKDRKA
ncbi:bifunctional 4-hydroxy-2-oxoglutarate aldolase/2-dehydro-3-deoxy-phosphogluconate aldolase [Intestinimonas massiliensis (ex Afouda et al. 2020)]|uniref:bifunctional 4-hydroxy-2-oxoglutarate aldolase/2-dehydro-3-deoxy-phosphogluconate aldolase n=1 Tax=Intestinimonas massiliensis (ex Afouda et al. 2020) TaxID=1673721 RepID=UPI0010309F76|nr:bifunctional 4-hydroxy-2-oxoglutarate aldolase/2-dehydro-3-deoxy-phosphogluconate aldolase [Intestinimonas massiliensis (ex Afouda et al. 2020)]